MGLRRLRSQLNCLSREFFTGLDPLWQCPVLFQNSTGVSVITTGIETDMVRRNRPRPAAPPIYPPPVACSADGSSQIVRALFANCSLADPATRKMAPFRGSGGDYGRTLQG